MYKVGNYEFETKTQADTAQKELEGIRYIRSQTDMDDPDVVLQLYNSLILKEVFVTPVGFDFLRQLQEYLNTIPYIKNEDILPIPVYRPELIEEEDPEEERELRAKAAKRRQKKQRELKAQQKRKNRDYHGAYVVSTFFAFVFAMIIIGMFAITYFSDDKLKILVVDDESRMRKLVRDFLVRQEFDVIEAGDGEEALDLFYKDKSIALIILDVMMPKMNGWEVCREVRETSKVPIIMLTAKSEESDELMGFDLGVDEYIAKPFSPKILVARVEAILRRTNKLGDASEVKKAGAIVLDKTAHEVKLDGKTIDLSFKEFELLDYFLDNQGIALSRERILNSVWNYDYFGDARTIDTHVKKLRSKLGEHGDYIKTVWGMGYKFEV